MLVSIARVRCHEINCYLVPCSWGQQLQSYLLFLGQRIYGNLPCLWAVALANMANRGKAPQRLLPLPDSRQHWLEGLGVCSAPLCADLVQQKRRGVVVERCPKRAEIF